MWLSPAGGGEGRVPGEWWAVPAELQSCHGMQPPYTPPQSGHTSSSLPTSLKIIVKKPHNLNLITSVLSSRYLWSGSGTDSEAVKLTAAVGFRNQIYPRVCDMSTLEPEFQCANCVRVTGGWPGRWGRWRCVTGGERRHAWLPSPPPAPLQTGAIQVSQYSEKVPTTPV